MERGTELSQTGIEITWTQPQGPRNWTNKFTIGKECELTTKRGLIFKVRKFKMCLYTVLVVISFRPTNTLHWHRSRNRIFGMCADWIKCNVTLLVPIPSDHCEYCTVCTEIHDEHFQHLNNWGESKYSISYCFLVQAIPAYMMGALIVQFPAFLFTAQIVEGKLIEVSMTYPCSV